jgi:restriction endonuclease S subunit
MSRYKREYLTLKAQNERLARRLEELESKLEKARKPRFTLFRRRPLSLLETWEMDNG